MEGTLWKWTNFFSGWQPRWFVLEDGILSYYLSQDQVINGCKGSVKLSVCDVHVHATDPTRLDLVIPHEAHFYLRAPTQQERQRWLIALGSCKACLEDGHPAKVRHEESSGELRSRQSELRLYADLIRQQANTLKEEMSENSPPNMQRVNESTALLHAACDTLLRTLDECMKMSETKPRSSTTSASGSTAQSSSPVPGGPVSPSVSSNFEDVFHKIRSRSPSGRTFGGSSSLLQLVNGGDRPSTPSLPHSPPLLTGDELSKPTVSSIAVAPLDGGQEENGESSLQGAPIRCRPPRHRQKVKTFFSSMPASFEDIKLYKDSADIPSVPFMEACKSVMEIFTYLNNTALAPVKIDMMGNIRKLQQKYSTQPLQYPTVQSMIRSELENQKHRDPNSATVATLWLKRSVEFIREFLREVLKDDGECLEILASNAYNRSLRQYHGWVVRGVFALAAKALPTREVFFRQLAPSEEDYEHLRFHECLKRDMDYYVNALTRIIDILSAFYIENSLDQMENI